MPSQNLAEIPKYLLAKISREFFMKSLDGL
jgi:hypothetical protein